MAEINPDDVILWLVPHRPPGFPPDLLREIADKIMEENLSRVVGAVPDPHNQPVTGREEESGAESPSHHESRHVVKGGLVLLFSRGAKTTAGIVGGTAANADFRLPTATGVSNYHFAIAFDSRNQPVVKDLGSLGGTKVTYFGERGQRLSNFEWPLLGPSIANGKLPVLHASSNIAFKVILPERDYASPEHIKRVKAFNKGTDHAGDAEELLSALAIQSAELTRLPTGQQTPAAAHSAARPFVARLLGAGAFGVVMFRFYFSTGVETAVKSPPKASSKEYSYCLSDWKDEADMLQNISHKHIVTFLGATFSPHPELEFEYARGGSLEKCNDLSTSESTQVLHQLSSALDYLHRQTPPIGHRDIKPHNILVFHRGGPDGILVKFADFGLSKAAVDLKTCCGTPKWSAPELCAKFADPVSTSKDTYNVAVDIWSLGAVIGWLVCGDPERDPDRNRNYLVVTRRLQSYYKRCSVELDSDLLRLVTGMMLVEDPARRSSAKEVEIAAGALLQRLGSDPASAAAPARIVAFSGGLGLSDNAGSDDASDSETPDPPGPGTWDWDSKEQLVWIPKPAKEGAVEEVASPHGSTVEGSLWNAGSSINGPRTPQDAEDLPYDDRTVHLAGRKRSLPESLSAPRSLQLAADRPPPGASSRERPGPKRARRDGPSRGVGAEVEDEG